MVRTSWPDYYTSTMVEVHAARFPEDVYPNEGDVLVEITCVSDPHRVWMRQSDGVQFRRAL